MKSRSERYELRKIRVRRKVTGTPELPRLSVYRSLKHIYSQLIDDLEGRTLVAASSKDKGFGLAAGVKNASAVGQTIGQKGLAKGIKSVVVDRGARPYHGQIKALAESAREAGLKF